MSLRYKGGVISATPPTTTGGTSGTAKGVWTLEQQLQAQAAGNWPLSPPQAVQISRSLRFNFADSPYLSRTPASAGNRRTFTFSVWVKRSEITTNERAIFGTAPTGTDYFTLMFTNNNIKVEDYSVGFALVTSAVYRDPSAWYHIVFAVDTTQATASNRGKLYVNGSQITAFSTANYPSQNADCILNTANQHSISSLYATYAANRYFDGYMANIDFVDGQALTPSSFGQTNSTTGVWEPIQTVGYLTYGTNGFHLDFADNSGTTSTTLGKDTSGNSNNWTPNNFSVTAGVGNDSFVDTPTPYGTDTGAGGEVRGNYCTINALDTQLTLANGNLQFDRATTSWRSARATFGMSSGKWYWEVVATSASGTLNMMVGISTIAQSLGIYFGANPTGWGYNAADGDKYNNGNNLTYGDTFTTNDVIGISFDADSGDLKFYKNGTVQNSGTAAYTGLTSGPYFPTVALYGTATAYINFGQRAFSYTAPSGFKALVTQNLSTPTIIQPDDYFNTIIWTGTSNTASRSFTGVGFQPDFVWSKVRSTNYDHILFDVVRGAGSGKELVTSTTGAEGSGNTAAYGYLSSFNSDGFSTTAGTGGSLANVYFNGVDETYVAWNWKAGGAGVSNTVGTITSTVSANTTSKFSIVKYTGNGTSGATVGHGLGAVPQMIIFKLNQSGISWNIYHVSVGNQRVLYFATDAQSGTSALYFNNTTPSSTVFTLGSGYDVNNNGSSIIAYCFAPVTDFSAFGSYTGTGNASTGAFVYTGFRPAYVLLKRTDSTSNWSVMDRLREGYNVDNDPLYPNLTNAEGTTDLVDFLSNGFKIITTDASVNANTGTYIYAAFAENPFKYALAR